MCFCKEVIYHPCAGKVLVLANLTNNMGFNWYFNCPNSIFVEQGKQYSMEYQACLWVWWIGQYQTQPTTQFVYLTTLYCLIESTQQMKPWLILYTLGALHYAAWEDIDYGAHLVCDNLIGIIWLLALWSAVHGQYNNGMVVSCLISFNTFCSSVGNYLLPNLFMGRWFQCWINWFDLCLGLQLVLLRF